MYEVRALRLVVRQVAGHSKGALAYLASRASRSELWFFLGAVILFDLTRDVLLTMGLVWCDPNLGAAHPASLRYAKLRIARGGSGRVRLLLILWRSRLHERAAAGDAEARLRAIGMPGGAVRGRPRPPRPDVCRSAQRACQVHGE